MEQMTTDIAVLERALVVMAVCMAVQTLLCMAGAVAAFVAWRRAADGAAELKSMVEAQALELRRHLDHMSTTVDETARAIRHGSARVEEVITDARDAVGTARNAVGTVASVVTARRAAVAVGVWKGIQVWRRRREEKRLAAEAELQEEVLQEPIS
jgi:hypothetical protein